MCKYNPAGRFSNVFDAAARRPIFSVGGEIIPLKKSLCILPEVIEWNYPFLDNQRTQQINERGGGQNSPPSKRQRRDEWERKAQRFEPRQSSPLNNIAARRGGGNQVQNSTSRFDMLSSALRSVQSEFFFSIEFP